MTFGGLKMNKRLFAGLLLIVGGLVILGLMFFAQKEKDKADVTQSMINRALDMNARPETTTKADAESNPLDELATEPQGPHFSTSIACSSIWGSTLSDYCAGTSPDNDDEEEALTLCLNMAMQGMEVFGTDKNPLSAKVALTPQMRRKLACQMDRLYGASARFADASVEQILQEHMVDGGFK